MQYASRRLPFGPVLTVTLREEGLDVALGETVRCWPWDEIRQVELFLERRQKGQPRLFCRIHRADRAHVDLLHDSWVPSPTPFNTFVRRLHDEVGRRSPAATFETAGNPIAGAVVMVILGVLAAGTALVSCSSTAGVVWMVGGPDLRSFGLGIGAGLLFAVLPTLSVVALMGLVFLRSRPRSWSPDSIPPDLLAPW